MAAFAVIAAASAACNLITGAPDRVLDERDALGPTVRRDAGADAEQEDVVVEPSGDASTDDGAPGVVTVPVSTAFTSPNGGTLVTNTQGTRITGFTGAFNHPVIVPMPQPSIPSDDFTLTVTVAVQEASEFGILTRGQADSSFVVLGSMFGAVTRAFLGTMSPSNWNPGLGAQGPTYTFAANGRYRLSVKVQGTQVWGKMWEATQPEPDWQIVTIAPWATGRSIGFYVYNTTTPIVESMVVTVP
ncbi:MAG: hypothetical protein KF819_38095 [Labilithrix sp.]|nr:hypothetical protein [Labilithrix sp.]